METAYILQTQGFTDLLLELHPLLKAVQQGELGVRGEDLQHQTGKAGPASDVQDPLLRNGQLPEQRRAVQKVELRHVLLSGDGGEVHLCAALFQKPVIDPKALQRLRGAGEPELAQTLLHDFFQSHTLFPASLQAVFRFLWVLTELIVACFSGFVKRDLMFFSSCGMLQKHAGKPQSQEAAGNRGAGQGRASAKHGKKVATT